MSDPTPREQVALTFDALGAFLLLHPDGDVEAAVDAAREQVLALLDQLRAEGLDLGMRGVALLEWARQIRAADDQQTLLAIADNIEGKTALRAEGQPPQDGGYLYAGGSYLRMKAADADVATLRQQLQQHREAYNFESAEAASLRQQLAQAQQAADFKTRQEAETFTLAESFRKRAEAAEATVARLEAQQVRVMGDVPVSNTPRTSKDRHGVVAARGEKPDPLPDQHSTKP